MEKSSNELDPSYDPERITGISENDSAPSVKLSVPIISVTIPEYIYDPASNPFAYNHINPSSVDSIAKKIDTAIQDSLLTKDTLVRGLQSGKHTRVDRIQLVSLIAKNGRDHPEDEVHSAEYTPGSTILSILNGFHAWKPKCEEIPHYPVDIWMIFDRNAFDTIEYLHPRHNILVKDRWRLKNPGNNGLLGIVVVN